MNQLNLNWFIDTFLLTDIMLFSDDFKYSLKTPGIYLFYDENEKLIYVGKSKNLYKRILQHKNSSNSSVYPWIQKYLPSLTIE